MFEDIIDDDIIEAVDAQGLPEAKLNTDIVEHEALEAQILELINNDSMPHALILAGPKGIGKSTFGYRIARALLKKGIDDPNQDSMFGDLDPVTIDSLSMDSDDPIFRKVASGGHPDFLGLERPMDERKGQRKATFDIDTARKVAPFLRMTSSDGGWRVVLIDDADTMNRNAQNAILKVLEEPPANALLILICHRVGAMIPTIRSRCRMMNMRPLENDTVVDLMKREYPGEPDSELKIIASMAEGSIGRALSLMEEGGQDSIHTLVDVLEHWQNWNWPQIHRLADSLGRVGQDKAYKTFVQVFEWTLESLLFAKARDEIALDAPLDHKALRNMLSHYSLEEWVKICENLKAHFDMFERGHLDKRQAVLGAFSHIA
ncbi:MAG: DNA polymerase III subunit delta' [Pseudomonadota bacterium]